MFEGRRFDYYHTITFSESLTSDLGISTLSLNRRRVVL